MDPRRFGWDRIVGGALLLAGLVLASAVNTSIFGRSAPVVGGSDVGISATDIHLLLAASLACGWSLPLLVRGRARRPLTILLAVETPIAVWIAVGLAQSLPP